MHRHLSATLGGMRLRDVPIDELEAMLGATERSLGRDAIEVRLLRDELNYRLREKVQRPLVFSDTRQRDQKERDPCR